MSTTDTSYDKRFYGIYRGVVVDTNDPLKANRLKVRVPQVTGNAVTNWANPCLTVAGISNSFPNGVFGSFQSYFSQPLVTANVAQVMTLDVVDAANGVTIVNDSQITVNQTGLYNIQWSGQFQNADTNSERDAYVWIRKAQSGTVTTSSNDVAGSTGYITIPRSRGSQDLAKGHTIAAWNYLINLKKDECIEFWWSAVSTNVSLEYYPAGTGPIRPETASFIVTVDPVSTPLSAAGNGVWVMYEGGDPNFPVWMGVFGPSVESPIFAVSDYVMDGGGV